MKREFWIIKADYGLLADWKYFTEPEKDECVITLVFLFVVFKSR
ncbi:hypothetical protein GPLA_0506 [Paraglaciecola polaris LMG 21857]|uniref:Uncharacterized protein n=1 Tax=Paraglaciecola polaris LMG 21857 TaxID=1129793 RepID=K6ZRE5_9ALTE|nr:hypothetical protein GPLA_0506 [Paraglaciecola polaris LMG 21857]